MTLDDGPRFVPGRVVENGDRVTFIPSQIVQTDSGNFYGFNLTTS